MDRKVASAGWEGGQLLAGKTLIVTGCASGIGLETAGLIKDLGGDVIGVDREMTTEHVDELYRADLSDKRMIQALVKALPEGADGIANMAGLSPAAPAEMVLKVNWVGLKFFTHAMVPRLADGASIVNLAAQAGAGWPDAANLIKAGLELDFAGVPDFIRRHGLGDDPSRPFVFTKQALIAWTHLNRWTWRERGIRMNALSPGPVDSPSMADFSGIHGEAVKAALAGMDRPGQAADIAPVAAFLLSDMSKWIRGADIPVDGGLSSHLLCNKLAL